MQQNAFTLCVIEMYHFIYSCPCSTMLLHCVLQRGIISFTRVNVAECFYTVCYREVSFHLLVSMQHNAFTLCVIERYHFIYSCQCSTMLLHCVLQRGIILFTRVHVAQCFYTVCYREVSFHLLVSMQHNAFTLCYREVSFHLLVSMQHNAFTLCVIERYHLLVSNVHVAQCFYTVCYREVSFHLLVSMQHNAFTLCVIERYHFIYSCPCSTMLLHCVLQRGIISFTRVNVAQCFYTVCYIEVSFHLLVSMQHNAFTLCVIERQHFINSCQCSTLLLHPMINSRVLQRGIILFTRVNVAQCFYTVCYREVSFHLLVSMQQNAFTLCVIEMYHFIYSCPCSTMLLHCVLQRGIISFTRVNVAECFYTVCYREVSFHLLVSMQHNAFTLCVIERYHLLVSMQHNAFTLCVIERYHFIYSCQCSTMLLHCVLQRGIILFTRVHVAQCFYTVCYREVSFHLLVSMQHNAFTLCVIERYHFIYSCQCSTMLLHCVLQRGIILLTRVHVAQCFYTQ